MLQTSKSRYFYSNNFIVYKRNDDNNKNLSIKDYLDEIKPNLKNILNNHKKFDTWKIQLTIKINFISSKNIDEKRVIQRMITCKLLFIMKQMKLFNNFFDHLFLDIKQT